MSSKFPLLGFYFLLCSIVIGCSDPPPPLKITIKQTLSNLNLLDIQGQPYEFRIATGKVLILNIWASWCPPCRDEMPSLEKLAKHLGSKKFMLVGLSMDNDPHFVREYLREQEIHFPSYIDVEMKIATQQFGLRAYPTTLIISPKGVLLAVFEGWRDWQDPNLIKIIQAFSK